ncbi:MAG TPA: hypothetical protein VIV11_36320 [Kofleriaceae bacterium]
MSSRVASLLLAALLAGCVGMVDGSSAGDDTGDDGSGSGSGSGSGEQPALDCSAACDGIERDHELKVTDGNYGGEASQKWATCFSCRCKSALVELPKQSDLTCSSAEGPLSRWRPTRDGIGNITGVEPIDPNGTDTTGCMNPGMAAAGCDLQARFKRFFTNGGKTEYQQLCRKRDVGSTGYYEYLIIGHNTQNGATCFWQARDSTFDGETVPTLDLLAATTAEKKQYAETFYQYSAGPSSCTSCHSTDAFLTSPYLHSAWSIQQANADSATRSRIQPNKPYMLVTADIGPQSIVTDELTGQGKPLQASCGGCHRVSKGQYCGFAAKSIAEERIGALSETDIEQLRTSARHLMYWMPPGGTQSHAATLQLQQTVRDACAQ